jgi:hypothetical protein
MISKPSKKNSFRVQGSNQAVEQIALRAIEMYYGKLHANELVNSYIRAPVTNQSLIDDFGNFDVPYVKRCNTAHYKDAFKELSDVFPDKKFFPVHFCDTPFYKWNLSTSVGEPYCDDKHLKDLISTAYLAGELESTRMTKNVAVNYVLLKTRPTVHNIKDGKLKAIPHTWVTRVIARSHLSIPDEPKVRAVYSVPFPILIIECMFLWPIIAYLKESTSSPLLWGYETARGGAKRIHNESQDDEIFLMIDWSKFDKHLQHWLILDILDMLEQLFDFSQYMPNKLDPRYASTSSQPERIKRLFAFIKKFYTNGRLRTPDGALWELQFSGLLSGCFGTSLIGSLANYIIISTVLKTLNIKYRQIKVLGDDSLSRILLGRKLSPVEEQLLLNAIQILALRLFGAKLSIVKSRITDDRNKIVVLSYGYNGQTYRNTDDLLPKLLFPERRLSVESTKSRAVGIAIANFGKDPKIYEVCKNIYYHLHNVQVPKDIYLTWFDEEILQVRNFLLRDIFPTYEETFMAGIVVKDHLTDHSFSRAFEFSFQGPPHRARQCKFTENPCTEDALGVEAPTDGRFA